MSLLLLHLFTPVLGHVFAGFLPLVHVLPHALLIVEVLLVFVGPVVHRGLFFVADAVAYHLLERDVLHFFDDAIALPRIDDLVGVLFRAEMRLVR